MACHLNAMTVPGISGRRAPIAGGPRPMAQWIVLLVVSCAATQALFAWSAATDYALIMPKAHESLLLDIASAGNRLVEVGERGHILYSDDRGETWVQAKVPTSVTLTRVFFISETTGWAVGHDGNILFTTDGGVNWTLQRDGISDQAQINEERVARARLLISDLQQQLATVSLEGKPDLLDQLEEAQSGLEEALDVMDEPVYAPPLMDIWFANQEQGWAVGAFGTLLRSSNGGRSWDDYSHSVDNPEELHFNGVTGDAAGTVYLAAEWGYVFRSTSGGEHWQAVETGFEGSFFGVIVNPTTGSVFAYGLLGTIYRSSDRGLSWQPLESGTRDSLFGAASNPAGRLVFVGQNGTAVRTDDDGARFRVLDADLSRGLYGVALLGDQDLVATGEGGSARLDAAAASAR